MNRKDSPQSVIDSYRKRQQMAPFVLLGLAVVLVVAGIALLVWQFWGKGNTPAVSGVEMTTTANAALATNTSEPTKTRTPLPPTATITLTPTITETPTPENTNTPTGPMLYKVKDGDTCWALSQTYKVGLDVLLAINNFAPGKCPIKPGDEIYIPLPDTKLPTMTPIATGQVTMVDYTVQSGDTVALIAAKFNTTVDQIKKDNPQIKDINKINAGDKIKVKANTVTATPTKAVTSTNTPGGATSTPVPPTATSTPKQ